MQMEIVNTVQYPHELVKRNLAVKWNCINLKIVYSPDNNVNSCRNGAKKKQIYHTNLRIIIKLCSIKSLKEAVLKRTTNANRETIN
ncbi:hypothetical protein V1477_002689 [Vespula maculifrons]|uniref:Uncharacterized protein n=1 Tax=Vespula maculifrons TaxID=7453 RepID=A0ABD2CVB4_VESMC